MRFDADSRLAAAAGGVARYFADAAGLENGVVSELQSATIAVCNREFERLHQSSQRLEVTVTRSPDRIEVVVSRQGAEASPGTEQRQASIAGVDRVQHETQLDLAITRLTKYVGESASRK